jgi:predicted RNA binding protein YcfA (HicA-like mRNA interferase family)
MTAREVVQILRDDGFRLHSQRGSHQKWQHPRSGIMVVVPWHQGRSLPVGTLRAIQRESGIPDSAWESE